MNKFLREFKDRGFFYQCTNESLLSEILDKKKIKAYIGFDCTAESLHVGSLLQIMCLKLLQNHGHQPIVLLGGGTTRIGDPSGKDKTRKILSEKEIEKNSKNIKKILKNFLDTKNKNGTAEQRRLFIELINKKVSTPIIISRSYQNLSKEQLQLSSSADIGSLLLDGLGDGIFIRTKNCASTQEINNLSFGKKLKNDLI